MKNDPIGVFDSGLGGLTAVRALLQMLPDENIIYFGDTGRMPYGGRPREQIRRIARQNIAFVENCGVKAILAACGTISSNAGDILRENPTRIVGVLSPGAAELAQTGCKRLCVIATQTSIASGAFEREIRSLAPDAELLSIACPDFVPMIEAGHIGENDPVVRETVARTLRPAKDFGAQAMLLGCTHYGIIAQAIGAFLPETELIGAADAAAREMRRYLTENGLLSGEKTGDTYYTSGPAADFAALAPVMLGQDIRDELRFIPPEVLA